ncbi:MAG: hypothetical protein IKS72_05745 [Prevotella sp.]|nr:hypothetical protein [Prevotella sp.]
MSRIQKEKAFFFLFSNERSSLSKAKNLSKVTKFRLSEQKKNIILEISRKFRIFAPKYKEGETSIQSSPPQQPINTITK